MLGKPAKCRLERYWRRPLQQHGTLTCALAQALQETYYVSVNMWVYCQLVLTDLSICWGVAGFWPRLLHLAALCYKKSSRWEQVAKDAQTALGLSRDLMKVNHTAQ
jgi:hypothetical protein